MRGELVGGCDIVTEMYESGELAEVLGVEPPPTPRPRRPRPPSPAPPPLQIDNKLA